MFQQRRGAIRNQLAGHLEVSPMFQPRRYQVVGAQPVLDHEPGAIFEADIPPVQEERLLASGALRVLPVPAKQFPPALDIEPPNPEQKQQDDGAAAHTQRSE